MEAHGGLQCAKDFHTLLALEIRIEDEAACIEPLEQDHAVDYFSYDRLHCERLPANPVILRPETKHTGYVYFLSYYYNKGWYYPALPVRTAITTFSRLKGTNARPLIARL